MTEIKIEIFNEASQNVMNIIDFSIEQEIDFLSFNGDDYINLIHNDDFAHSVKEAVISSDTWLFDYNQENSEKLNLDIMRQAVQYDHIIIKIIKIGDRDLSFLSVNHIGDNIDDCKEFLNWSIDESFSFEDSFDDWCSESSLSLEYILNL